MIKYEVVFLEPARNFLKSLELKTQKKVLFNIWKSRELNDPVLFKKLKGDIWEFRTLFNGNHIRLFAFWDKRNETNTLVIITHGIIKKTQKTPEADIEKAITLQKKYLENK